MSDCPCEPEEVRAGISLSPSEKTALLALVAQSTAAIAASTTDRLEGKSLAATAGTNFGRDKHEAALGSTVTSVKLSVAEVDLLRELLAASSLPPQSQRRAPPLPPAACGARGARGRPSSLGSEPSVDRQRAEPGAAVKRRLVAVHEQVVRVLDAEHRRELGREVLAQRGDGFLRRFGTEDGRSEGARCHAFFSSGSISCLLQRGIASFRDVEQRSVKVVLRGPDAAANATHDRSRSSRSLAAVTH